MEEILDLYNKTTKLLIKIKVYTKQLEIIHLLENHIKQIDAYKKELGLMNDGPNKRSYKDRTFLYISEMVKLKELSQNKFYIDYTSTGLSTPISPSNNVDIIATASALNFLLISDGSAVLRYST